MAKSKKKKAQEAHVAAELELFEAQGKAFRCRGSQEQDVAKIVQKLEASQRASERAAERAEASGDEAQAVSHRERAKATDSLVQSTLAVAQELKDEDAEVRTGTIVGRMARDRGPANALDNVARSRCGQDLAETIAALPRDGYAHDYECPKCGRAGSVVKTPVEDAA